MSRYPFNQEEQAYFERHDVQITGLSADFIQQQLEDKLRLEAAQAALKTELENTRTTLTAQLSQGDDAVRREVEKVLVKAKIAEEPISALQIVYPSSTTNVGVADCNDPTRLGVYGIAMTAALTGEIVYVRIFGEVKDDFFQYAPGAGLFLGFDGAITDHVSDTMAVLVPVGRSLGAGGIIFQPTIPVIL